LWSKVTHGEKSEQTEAGIDIIMMGHKGASQPGKHWIGTNFKILCEIQKTKLVLNQLNYRLRAYIKIVV
jgi:hypothetical protein